MRLSAVLASLLTLALVGAAGARPAVRERPDLALAFTSRGVDGTFVLYDPASDEMTVVNRSRAERRFVPASTFKIPNTLIALETGAVRDVDEVLPYGGKPQPFKEWERDMPMREAIRLSAVPIYQEVARRVGLQRMRNWVERLGYGNRTIGKQVDRFWLDGPLVISPVEQARWVSRLPRRKLPLSARAISQAEEILKIEERGGTTLYAKTGWEDRAQVGWWTGWVRRGDRVHSFALNMDIRRNEQAPLRLEIGRELLAKLGVYP